MFEFPYKIIIYKKKTHKPVRLEKITEEEKLMDYFTGLNTKINIILFILIIVILFVACYMLVPQTYGFYHW